MQKKKYGNDHSDQYVFYVSVEFHHSFVKPLMIFSIVIAYL